MSSDKTHIEIVADALSTIVERVLLVLLSGAAIGALAVGIVGAVHRMWQGWLFLGLGVMLALVIGAVVAEHFAQRVRNRRYDEIRRRFDR